MNIIDQIINMKQNIGLTKYAAIIELNNNENARKNIREDVLMLLSIPSAKLVICFESLPERLS